MYTYADEQGMVIRVLAITPIFPTSEQCLLKVSDVILNFFTLWIYCHQKLYEALFIMALFEEMQFIVVLL